MKTMKTMKMMKSHAVECQVSSNLVKHLHRMWRGNAGEVGEVSEVSEVSVGEGQRLLQDGQHHRVLLRNTGLHLQREESLVPGTTGWGFPPQSEDPTCAQHGGVAH